MEIKSLNQRNFLQQLLISLKQYIFVVLCAKTLKDANKL